MFAAGTDIAEHVNNLEQNALAVIGPHLVVAPMYHTGPLSGVRAPAAGTPLVVKERFDAEAVLAMIERYRAAASVMVPTPTHFGRLLALPDATRARYDLSSLVLVGHTGSRCPPGVKRAMIDWWGPVIVESYGATEAGVLTTIDSHDWLAHPGSVGRANPASTRRSWTTTASRFRPAWRGACTSGTCWAAASSTTTRRRTPPTRTWSRGC